jgi:hypothetical protein
MPRQAAQQQRQSPSGLLQAPLGVAAARIPPQNASAASQKASPEGRRPQQPCKPQQLFGPQRSSRPQGQPPPAPSPHLQVRDEDGEQGERGGVVEQRLPLHHHPQPVGAAACRGRERGEAAPQDGSARRSSLLPSQRRPPPQPACTPAPAPARILHSPPGRARCLLAGSGSEARARHRIDHSQPAATHWTS